MLQPATTSTVIGDFGRRRTTLRGQTFGLEAREGSFWITESALTGRPRTHRVDFTLGSRRIQHYLTPARQRSDRGPPPHLGRDPARVVPERRDRPARRGGEDDGPGVEQDLRGVPRQRTHEGLRHRSTLLLQRLAGPGHELRTVPRAGARARRARALAREGRARRARGSRGRGGRRAQPLPARRHEEHDALRAVPYPARRGGRRLHRGKRLLRSLHAHARVRAAGRPRPRVVGGRPAAPLLQRRPRVLAEPVLPQGQGDLHLLPPRPSPARRRPRPERSSPASRPSACAVTSRSAATWPPTRGTVPTARGARASSATCPAPC